MNYLFIYLLFPNNSNFSIQIFQYNLEKISPEVPKFEDLDNISNSLLQNIPEDKIAICHGDFKFDNLVIFFLSLQNTF